jgi:hypothetical protein
MGCHTNSRLLFTSPSSTPNLYRIHDTHLQASTHRSGSRGGDKDEANDVVNMVAFLGARHVTSMGTLPCTVLVDDNKLPLKQIRLPGSFSYFNCFMLSISYTNHIDYYFLINDHIFLCVVNDHFYRHLKSKTLLIFWEKLCMRWKFYNSNLKKELMDYLEGLFGVDMFNKKAVISATGKYLKYMRGIYI